MRPKKSYGQHFLKNESIAQRIASCLTGSEFKAVLEIGPGKGMLTQFLLSKGFHLKLIELDPDMVPVLNSRFPEIGNNLILGDAIKLPWEEIFAEPFAVIGNFPYNISSQILFKVLRHKDMVVEAVGMFQKEVAQRITADHGNKSYGIISVLLQAYYDTDYLFEVGHHEFSPPPKVESAVIRLKRKTAQPENLDEQFFRKLVKVGFGQRRKMLRNTLKPFLVNAESFDESILTRRPEQLSVEEFMQLARDLKGKSGSNDLEK